MLWEEEEGGGGVKEGTEAMRTEKRVCASLGPCRRQSAGTTRSSSLRGGKGVTSARCHTKGLGRWLVIVVVAMVAVLVVVVIVVVVEVVVVDW